MMCTSENQIGCSHHDKCLLDLPEVSCTSNAWLQSFADLKPMLMANPCRVDTTPQVKYICIFQWLKGELKKEDVKVASCRHHSHRDLYVQKSDCMCRVLPFCPVAFAPDSALAGWRCLLPL